MHQLFTVPFIIDFSTSNGCVSVAGVDANVFLINLYSSNVQQLTH